MFAVHNYSNLSDVILPFRDVPTKKHLKNVYSSLAMSMFAAAAGGAVHMYTQFLKVEKLLPPHPLFFSTDTSLCEGCMF
jgi:hypothetical protein